MPQKMHRPTVWNCDGSTFYKSWNTTLYYKNEAYVCGFVGMEVNKEKAFEIWHRRPDLDLSVAVADNVIEGGRIMEAMHAGNNEDVPTMQAMSSNSPTLVTEMKETAVSRREKVAMKSPTMKMEKKPAMIQKTAVKKGVDKPKKAAMKSPARKTVKKTAVQTATIMKKAMKRSN